MQVWEVRSLREDYGEKLALLSNPDFTNQHTDSHSVGLISLDPTTPQGEAVKDLLDWNTTANQFFKDVLASSLHYYYNPQHKTTLRFKEGKNPGSFFSDKIFN